MTEGSTTKSIPIDIEQIELVEQAFEPTRIVDTRQSIGRYELVYELGIGGMANVYLARARGPAGFHKWFAIKRIHPHLAKDQRFVDMFLDEARIAAAVHHPNVAQVFDLGEQAGEYFIAMEYMHGEHLGALSVRCVREMGRVPFALAARIGASVADGLHHAHEVKDQRGRALGLVHRDISPQNVFVTFDGAVKVTDFGVAKAAGRITSTQTGGTKGKCAYMAPEQALGQSVDRRTDIFALGIVLWEITTGRRLFKASSDAQTLMRITSGRVHPPSAIAEDYPPELERIVLKALAPRKEERYPSAGAMARDLERYIAGTGTPIGANELAALMHRLFPDRMVAKDEILRGEPGTSTRGLPAHPRGAEASSGTGALPMEISQSDVMVRARGRRSRAWVIALLALAAVGLSAAITVAVVVLGAKGGVVRIDTRPSGAAVMLDGHAEMGTTPVLLEEVPSGRHRLRLTLAGHAQHEVTFDTEGDRVDLAYDLARLEDGRGEDVAVAANAPAPEAPPTEPAPETPPPEAPPTPETPPTTAPVSSTAGGAEESPTVAGTEPDRPPRDPTATPQRGTAFLNLITRPWATVIINGRDAGTTPLMRRQVPAGQLVIRLRAQGTGPERTLRLRAAPGETVSRSLGLE